VILRSPYPDAASPAFAGFRYYRISILANNGDALITGIIEAELRATSGGADLTTGLATSSITDSTHTANLDGFKAFDNSLTSGSGWATASGNATGWVRIDLGTASPVLEYLMGSYASTNNTSTRSAKQWLLEGSSDGSTWLVLDVRSMKDGWTFGEQRTLTVLTPDGTGSIIEEDDRATTATGTTFTTASTTVTAARAITVTGIDWYAHASGSFTLDFLNGGTVLQSVSASGGPGWVSFPFTAGVSVASGAARTVRVTQALGVFRENTTVGWVGYYFSAVGRNYSGNGSSESASGTIPLRLRVSR
jgi:hypothetical protein